jgi:hypothetical protein
VGVQHLERDRASVLDVLGQEDRGHPSAAQLPIDAVTVAGGPCERRELVVRGQGISP